MRGNLQKQMSADCGSREGRRFESLCSPPTTSTCSIDQHLFYLPCRSRLRRPKRCRLYSASGVSVHVFTGVPFRFSVIFILATVGAVSAPFRISMALYRWGRGCIPAQSKGDTHDALRTGQLAREPTFQRGAHFHAIAKLP